MDKPDIGSEADRLPEKEVLFVLPGIVASCYDWSRGGVHP